MRILRRVAVVLAVALVAGSLGPVPGAAGEPVVRNPGDPAYEVRLRAGAGGRVWSGRATIAFTNLEEAPLSQVHLRLWSNGVDGCAGRAIEIWEVAGGTPGPAALECTEVPVTLDRPLARGERGTLSMRVQISLPRRADRFGFSGGLALVGTALPTLEVHDDHGWHHDAFEDLGESFYSVVGTYRVTLVGAADLDTPATGTQVASRVLANGMVARTFLAADVRDFAWAAGRLDRVVGTEGSTRIVVSYRPASVTRREAQRMLAAAQQSLATFSESFGEYPYPELDVVLGAFPDFGGMEYPTIVFSEPDKWTVAHEIAHQWWYGLVGNDQYASPWLDESVATWSEALPFEPWVGCASYDFPGEARITNDMGYWADHPGQYDTVYDGGGCMLANLAGRFGLEGFLGILEGYASAHWLGVARSGDLTGAIETAAERELPGFDAERFWAAWRVDVP